MKKKKKGSPPFVFNGDREFGANDVLEIVAGGSEKLRLYDKEVEEIIVEDKAKECPFLFHYEGDRFCTMMNYSFSYEYCNFNECPLKNKIFTVRLK